MTSDERREKLQQLKAKLQGTELTTIQELRTLNQNNVELKYILEKFLEKELSVTIEAPKVEEKEIPAPIVNVAAPIVNVEPPEVKTTVIIDEKALKPLQSIIVRLNGIALKAKDGVQEVLTKLLKSVNRIVELISEPDEVIIEKDQIIERYGKRTVITTFVRSGKKIKKIIRAES